jgi:hypothetical protein
MKAAITVSVPAQMTLAEEQKVQLSTLVHRKLEETKTLTLVSTDEQFETAGEQLKIIAQLRERLKGTLKPYIEFWHKGRKGWRGTRGREKKLGAGKKNDCDEKPRSYGTNWERKSGSGGNWIAPKSS